MDFKYNLQDLFPPQMPNKLPGFIKAAISEVPKYMAKSAANCVFPPASALMHGVKFVYFDNTNREVCCLEGSIAVSGFGKGYLDPIKEAIVAPLVAHDRVSRPKQEKYNEEYKRAGSNQKKPERPKDAILLPEPDMSNPAFITLLKNAEYEGDRCLYTDLPEIDLLNQTCGGHKKVTNVIRLAFDVKRYGAERATPDGVSGNPMLRWRFNFSTTIVRAQQFFRDCAVDGTLGRIGFSYEPKMPDIRRNTPRQGNYDDKYMARLEPYLERLGAVRGKIKIPALNKLIVRLAGEMADITELADDDDFQSLANRSLMIAFFKGCILWVAEGSRFTKESAEYVEWSLYYDLWSKLKLFYPMIKKANQMGVADTRKYGPSNILDMMPLSFSMDQLETKRESLGKEKNGYNQITTWSARGYITFDEKTGLYTKSEQYLSKHPQDPQV